jgi:hypothetical protein
MGSSQTNLDVTIFGQQAPAEFVLGEGLKAGPLEVWMRPCPSWRWHLDEIVVAFVRKRMHLWRAIDHEGEILDISAHYDSLIAVQATISKVPTKAHLPAV